MPARKTRPGWPEVPAPAVLRFRDTAGYIGLRSRTSLYNLVESDPKFPRPRKIGGLVVWLKAELDAWLATGAPIAL
jgi:predicted DNA-binding transcriptional regulator AlpA